MKCQYCGSDKIVDGGRGFLVCASCGCEIPGSNIAMDSYHNHVFLDDWKKTETRLRARRFSWTGVVSSEPGESRTAVLVRQHLVELVRSLGDFKLVAVVKYCRATSLKDLFRDFLMAVGDYEKARRLFEKACELAYAEPPDLAPSNIYTESFSKARIELRRRRLEEAYSRVRELWGEEVEKVTRILCSLPLFQPADPLATGLAVAIVLRRASLRDAGRLGVGRRRIELKLKRVKLVSRLPLPLLASLGKELYVLRGISRHAIEIASSFYYTQRYKLRTLHSLAKRRESSLIKHTLKLLSRESLFPRELAGRLGISKTYARVLLYRLKSKGLVERLPSGRYRARLILVNSLEERYSLAKRPKLTYDPLELIEYYNTYAGYVKACRKLLGEGFEPVKPLPYRTWLMEKWILRVLPKARLILEEMLKAPPVPYPQVLPGAP